MIIPIPISFCDAKMNTFVKNSCILELLENQTLTNISSHTHSTKHLQCLVSYSVSQHFSRTFHSTAKYNYVHDQKPCSDCYQTYSDYYSYTVWPFLLSGLQFCLLFIHFIFAHRFTSFSAFVYSLLSDDLCWLLIGYSLLDTLFLFQFFR